MSISSEHLEENRNFIQDMRETGTILFLLMRRYLEMNPDLIKNFPKLTPVQTLVLRNIADYDGISQSKLAVISGKDNPGMTRILDNLEKQGLVKRKRDFRDRRVVRIHLDSRAKKMIRDIEPLYLSLFEVTFADFSEEEKFSLIAMCKRMRDNCNRALELIEGRDKEAH